MRDRTEERFGRVADIGEEDWVQRYLGGAPQLACPSHSNTLLPRTVYRMDGFWGV